MCFQSKTGYEQTIPGYVSENTGDKNINTGYKSENIEDMRMNTGEYEINTGGMWTIILDRNRMVLEKSKAILE